MVCFVGVGLNNVRRVRKQQNTQNQLHFFEAHGLLSDRNWKELVYEFWNTARYLPPVSFPKKPPLPQGELLIHELPFLVVREGGFTDRVDAFGEFILVVDSVANPVTKLTLYLKMVHVPLVVHFHEKGGEVLITFGAILVGQFDQNEVVFVVVKLIE